MAESKGLTKAKIADLRKRMASHGVKKGKAVVELTARELQLLLDAADPPAPKYERAEIPRPDGDSPKHLYSITIIVAADATDDPNFVVEHVMAACLRHPELPLTVVDGYGISAKNLTLTGPGNRGRFGGGMVQIGFANKAIPKKATSVPVFRRVGL